MGQTILFPSDREREEKLGKTAWEKGDYGKAQSHFERAYQAVPDYQLNRQIVSCLEKQGAFHQALQFAEEFQEEYDQDPAGFDQLFHLYLLHQDFLMARKYLCLATRRPALADFDFAQAKQELKQLEQVFAFYDLESVQEKREYLLQVNRSLFPVPQGKWEEVLARLPYASFVSIAKEVLAKAHNPYLRPRLVEELVKLGYQEELVIQDLKGVAQTCCFKDLRLPLELPTLRQMLQYLEKEHGQEDPILLDSIKGEVEAHFALAYPFAPQIKAPLEWAESYWQEYQVALGTIPVESLTSFAEIQLAKQDLRNLLQIQL